jgi:hypothetical protein
MADDEELKELTEELERRIRGGDTWGALGLADDILLHLLPRLQSPETTELADLKTVVMMSALTVQLLIQRERERLANG